MKLLIILGVLIFCSGCTTGYWLDRRADAADVFTVTVGTGGGFSARVGPVGLGVLTFQDKAGLRGGMLGRFGNKSRSAWFIGPGKEHFLCSQAYIRDKAFASKIWFLLDSRTPKSPSRSGSSVNVSGDFSGIGSIDAEGLAVVAAVIVAVCSVSLPLDVNHYPDESYYACHWPYFTEIQATAGLGGGVRLGFNPGELLDCLLGFVGKDVYGDDFEAGKEQRL